MVKSIATYEVSLGVDVQLSFCLDDCFVYVEKDTKLLKIIIEYKLKSFESIVDLSIFTRATYLGVLGIVSFLVGEPLDVFGASGSKKIVEDDSKLSLRTVFIQNGINKSHVLKNLLHKFHNIKDAERKIIFSLLDRWRKARFLEKESEDSCLYNDEAILSYFHVLELLGNISSVELSKKLDQLVKDFSLQYNAEVLSLSGEALESETNAKAKLISSLLNKDITISAKILSFLKQYNLFDLRTSYFVKSLIEARNSIAHGKTVCRIL